MPVPPGIVAASTTTKLTAADRGQVLIGASHGGVYSGYLTAKAGCRGAILNDAGVGKDRAGLGSLDYLAKLGLPAATVSHMSARIGDGADTAAHGVISHINAIAAALGCAVGQSAVDCALRMTRHPATATEAPSHPESRFLFRDGARQVWGLDSASLVRPEHEGHIVVTASHGALLDGKPDGAIQARAHAALFNDAGVGKDRAGISRLPVLDAQGIAGACVDAMTARIGDARSMWETGVVSHVNETARRHGGAVGQSVQAFVAAMLN